jgi:hypothetical protein
VTNLKTSQTESGFGNPEKVVMRLRERASYCVLVQHSGSRLLDLGS